MKKSILNLGKTLNKAAQKSINGGKIQCDLRYRCGSGQCCNTRGWCQTFGAHVTTGLLCDADFV